MWLNGDRTTEKKEIKKGRGTRGWGMEFSPLSDYEFEGKALTNDSGNATWGQGGLNKRWQGKMVTASPLKRNGHRRLHREEGPDVEVGIARFESSR